LINEEDHLRFFAKVRKPNAAVAALAYELLASLANELPQCSGNRFNSLPQALPQALPQTVGNTSEKNDRFNQDSEKKSDTTKSDNKESGKTKTESNLLAYAYSEEFGFLSSCPSNLKLGVSDG
jgi:hypothetical protein